jgi:hypothetical protein
MYVLNSWEYFLSWNTEVKWLECDQTMTIMCCHWFVVFCCFFMWINCFKIRNSLVLSWRWRRIHHDTEICIYFVWNSNCWWIKTVISVLITIGPCAMCSVPFRIIAMFFLLVFCHLRHLECCGVR